MRSILVLILVAAAATGIFFTYKSLGARSAETVQPGERGPQTEDPASGPVAELGQAREVEIPKTPIDTGRRDVDPTPVEGGSYVNSLSGRVINEDNQAVAQATVTLSSRAKMGEEIALSWLTEGDSLQSAEDAYELSMQTGADGRYQFKGIEPSMKYYIVAQHPEYSFAQESYVEVGAEGDFVGPDVVLTRGSVVFGYITDTSGAAVLNATVHLDSSYMLGQEIESPDRMTTQADDRGFFELTNVSAGPRNLSVSAPGYGSQILHNQTFTGRAGERIQKDFRLDVGFPIGGRVVDPNGAGIVGATVLAMNYGNNTSSRGKAVTGADGLFQIDDLRQGSYIVMVDAEGYRPGRMNRVQATDMNVTIDMLEQASISGCVVDASGNKPVTSFEASVRRVTPGDSSYEKVGTEKAFQTADGCFQLRGIDPGRYVVFVRATGYAPSVSEPFEVSASDPVAGITVRANAGGALRGRVVSASGTPVAGARVSSHDPMFFENNLAGIFGELLTSAATERSARTNSEGRFELELLTPGAYTLRVTHEDYTREYVQDLAVELGQATEVGDVAMRSGGTVRGKVYDGAGKVLARGYVHLRGDDQNSTYDVRTGADGAFEFRHVRPGGYKLSASSARPGAGADPLQAIAEQSNSEVSLSVSEGGEIAHDLNLGG